MDQVQRVKVVEFGKNLIYIRYTDDNDPPWARGRELAIDWEKNAHVERLAHVAYHIFRLFITNPEAVAANDEILQEWIGKLLNEHPEEGHELP